MMSAFPILYIILAWLGGLFGLLSYTAAVSPVAAPAPASHTTILFGGDMMFDRSIRTTAEEKGGEYLFSCLKKTLEDADLVVANLEGPITATTSRSVGSRPGGSRNFTFTFATSTAPLLAGHDIRLVNLGNNHIENFGTEGEIETERWLKSARVDYFGDTIDQRVATTTIHGIPFAFINYNQFALSSTASTTIEQITAAQASGRIAIVYTHWGDEYLPATDLEKKLAHQFVDAGAAIVIGSHPHVVQEHEVYHGAPIYYSLGNLIFDQYFSDAVRNGLMLRVRFDINGVDGIDEVPVVLQRDRRTCAATTTPAL